MRDADQFHIGKHYARTLVSVIQQHIDAGDFEFAVELFNRALHGWTLVHADRHEGDLERSDRSGQCDTPFIKILFNGGGNDA